MIARAALLLALLAGGAAAGDYGLVSNRSGLPLVFPLQVESVPGEDLRVTLHDAGTDETVLTARLEGGAFFRVLVPLGTHVVRFAPIDGGPIVQTDPLDFAVTGPARKGGHLVAIGDDGSVASRPIGLCQSFGYDPHALPELRDYDDALGDPAKLGAPLPIPPRRDLAETLCD